MAYVLRFIKACKTNDITFTSNAAELNHAELCWIGCVQSQESFKDEIQCILKSDP